MFDHVLDALDVSLEPFAFCEIRGNASMGLGRRPHAVLHYVLAGQGSVTVDGFPPISTQPGSVILIPAFVAHSLHSEGLEAGNIPECRPLEVAMEHLRAGTGDGVLAAICGRVTIAHRGLSGSIDLLKSPIIEHLDAADRLKTTMDDLVIELAHPTIGTRAFARTLLLQCIILLFRRRLQTGDTSLTWIRGLADGALWSAVQAMIDRPDRNHTVDSLADLSGMSRAAFASRFREAYGTGPIELLKTVRLRRAAELLAISDLPVKRISGSVGYGSRTYFSRAFKTIHGLSPDEFRRSVAAARVG